MNGTMPSTGKATSRACSPSLPLTINVFGNCPNTGLTVASELCNQDVADEDAAKIGAIYKFNTGTTIGAIVEHMDRYVPSDLDFQNERTRWGTWAFLTQELTPADSSPSRLGACLPHAW